ncbi:MAG: hypothetical protein ACOZAA_12030 [Pseudomonadota bacterium]
MINLDIAHAKATIAWLAANNGAPDARIAAAAKAAGYSLAGAGSPRARIDIAAIDLRGAEESAPIATALVSAARRLAPAAGIIIIASGDTAKERRETLRRHADVCYLRSDATPIIAAIRERLRLAALTDEVGDRIKSLVADGRSISFAGLAAEPPRLSVLIAGRPSPLTLSACNAVRHAASQTTCVFSAGQVMRALDHCRFDGAIFIPANEDDLLLALARALRRHRDHRRLSVILAAEDEDLLDRCAERDGFDFILADHIEPDLAQRLDLLSRRAALASAMRRFLRSADGCGGGKNGAANTRFFASHAVRAFRRADETGQPISLISLSIARRSAGGSETALTNGLNEALRTASRLVRAEDLIAKLSTHTLVFLLRGVREAEAQRIATRLEGVIAGTLLRSALDIAEISAAAVERRAGDDLETTVASLIRSLQGGRSDGRAAL